MDSLSRTKIKNLLYCSIRKTRFNLYIFVLFNWHNFCFESQQQCYKEVVVLGFMKCENDLHVLFIRHKIHKVPVIKAVDHFREIREKKSHCLHPVVKGNKSCYF